MQLTDEQDKIVNHQTHLVVLARPGSGKTFTLSRLIQDRLDKLADYKGVIAISFTNKASHELAIRTLKSGIHPKRSFFGTIDKFIIQEIIYPFFPHFFDVSLPREFKTSTLEDAKDIILDFDNFKAECLKPESYPNDAFIAECKRLYQQGIRILEACPKLALFVFVNSQDCRNYFKARYSHIIVDEFQDSGWEQYALFRRCMELGLIAIAVGDIDQSIYYFNRKDPKYLKALASNPAFATFKLTKNHRCHPSIINYSLSLISTSPELLDNKEHRVWYKSVSGDQKAVALWIAEKITSLSEKNIIDAKNDVAILCRNHNSALLLKANIGVPVKYFAETMLDKESDQSCLVFKGLLNTLHDGEVTSFDFVRGYFHEELDAKKYKKVLKLVRALKEKYRSGGQAGLSSDFFENICHEVIGQPASARAVQLLSEILIDTEQFTSYLPASPAEIQLMTLHKSKGLEFKVVFHVDLYDWVLPGSEAMKGNANELEQDKNLHYVGLTRAKEYCVLVTSTSRINSQGQVKTGVPSNFLSHGSLPKLRKQFS